MLRLASLQVPCHGGTLFDATSTYQSYLKSCTTCQKPCRSCKNYQTSTAVGVGTLWALGFQKWQFSWQNPCHFQQIIGDLSYRETYSLKRRDWSISISFRPFLMFFVKKMAQSFESLKVMNKLSWAIFLGGKIRKGPLAGRLRNIPRWKMWGGGCLLCLFIRRMSKGSLPLMVKIRTPTLDIILYYIILYDMVW